MQSADKNITVFRMQHVFQIYSLNQIFLNILYVCSFCFFFRYFIQDIGVPEGFLGDDIVSHQEYMSILEQVSTTYKTYQRLRSEYLSQSKFKKQKSELQVSLSEVQHHFVATVALLIEISNIRTGSNSLIDKLQSCQLKMNKITQSIPELFVLKNKMETIINSLQGAIRSQKARDFKKQTMVDDFKMFCENSCKLTWEIANENIQSMSEKSRLIFAPMSVESMHKVSEFCEVWKSSGNKFIPHQAIVEHFPELKLDEHVPAMVKQLTMYFPLLCVQSGSQYIMIDIHEMVWSPGLIYEILTLDISNKFKRFNMQQDTPEEKEDVEPVNEGIFFYSKSGPKPLEEKYPEILTELVDFCKLHGFAAHARRRNGTVSACGVRIEDIRQHLLTTVDGLQSISKSKVYNLVQPRRSNTKEASNHKNAADVSVGKKNTDISNDHPDVHAYFSAVRYVRELSAKYPEHFSVWSCDGKAKVHIGGQAVSRYHQLRTFFPNNDSPHYKDHDFPVPGYLIEPDGYLLLENKQQNTADEQFSTDKLGRQIYKYPATGPIWVFNRAVKYQSASVSDHISDVRNILKWNPDLKKPVQVFLTDGGPDWTPKSSLTAFFLGRFWKNENLDMVIACTNAPGWSRFNPIEHIWSSLSKFLAGVSLPSCMPGENKPPCLQSDLSEDERKIKEYTVFDSAVKDLNSYWDGRTHDGFNISSVGVSCTGVLQSKNENLNYTNFDTDYEKVKEMFACSLKKIKADESLNNLLVEWQYYVKHMDKRTGMVILKRESCGDNDCPCR